MKAATLYTADDLNIDFDAIFANMIAAENTAALEWRDEIDRDALADVLWDDDLGLVSL